MALETVPLRQLGIKLTPTLEYMDELDVIESNVRIYNDTGVDRIVSMFRASVAVPAEGTLPIIVDVIQSNVVSMFDDTTPPIGGGAGILRHKIYIPTGSYSVLAYPKLPGTWAAGESLTLSILQVGDTYAGQDLTVEVVIGE